MVIERFEIRQAFPGGLKGVYERAQAEVVRELCEWAGVPGRIVLPAPAGEKPMWLGYVELRRQNATVRLNFWTDFRPELSIQELLAPVLEQVNWELAAGKQARTKGRKGDYDCDLAG